MENIIMTPTREQNILDLCFTNSHTLINFYRTVINKKFSDHNTLEIDMNFTYNVNTKKDKVDNPYSTKVYEYDTETDYVNLLHSVSSTRI